MKTLILLLSDKLNPEEANLLASVSPTGYTVLRNLPENSLNPDDVLVVTDSSETARRMTSEGLAVVGFEHDGIRLSCAEIIDSLSVLTGDYCRQVHRSLTGREAVYTDGKISLYPLSEKEYCEAYEQYRLEPYILTSEQKSCTEADVRMQYRNRLALIQFSDCCGMFRVEIQGKSIGYGSVFEEQTGSLCLTTIDYYVHPNFRGRGCGISILQALTAYARSNRPGRPLYAKVHTDNIASVKALSACGYVPFEESDDMTTLLYVNK